ncbi:hypothetical protein AB0L41_12135 [Amycolatopsis mediterranei]|uniref:hypothetical protein n=1 Tax=Amycolatopsis mediterranei TaxID=33910 RepID=UPI0034234CC8
MAAAAADNAVCSAIMVRVVVFMIGLASGHFAMAFFRPAQRSPAAGARGTIPNDSGRADR